MKKWNDKTKKIVLVAALIVVGAGAFCGIHFTLKTDESVKAPVETSTAIDEDKDISINTEHEDLTVQGTEEPVISTEPIDSVKTTDTDDTTQTIQNDPVKTEESKPSEPPTEITETEQSSSGEKPKNEEIPASTEKPSEQSSTDSSSAPKDGDIKDGKIYFEGFGWVDYNGGGTSGIQADDIYENGNTIGIMD